MGISGMVYSAEYCSPLVGVCVTIRHVDGSTVHTTHSGPSGEWTVPKMTDDHVVEFDKDGYVPKTYVGSGAPGKVRLLEDRLIGYQRKLWFAPGEAVEAFVHSPCSYAGTLYRHGYRKEAVLEAGEFSSQRQVVPDGEFVDCGLDWTRSFQYRIPENAVPGIYSMSLQATGQESFAIPMIVSTTPGKYGERTRLLVLASTNNWLTYNTWGGRSRYRNYEDGSQRDFPGGAYDGESNLGARLKEIARRRVPARVKAILRSLWPAPPPPSWFFKRLSVRRPFTNCGLEAEDVTRPFTNHLAAGEWRLLAWLERENYGYDIISGYELHNDPSLLRHYRAVILNTHSEYWSRAMYEGLRAFHVENRGWVLNISGNSLFREVEYFEDGSLRCASLSFAESCADETKILGVRFTLDGYGTCAPYAVREPEHWAFEGISTCRGTTFGGLSLNQNTRRSATRYDAGRPGVDKGLEGCGASGWETDKLSRTAPSDIVVIAKGMNRRGGADMVIREPDGPRGGMFSASSIVFSGCLLIDDVASTLVQNVLRRALSGK